MGKRLKMNHQFVEYIPEVLEDGMLYISMRFGVAIHLCACGCRLKTVTPFSTVHDWKLTYDGKTVTLHPSISNYQYDCKSHYWIKNNIIEWC